MRNLGVLVTLLVAEKKYLTPRGEGIKGYSGHCRRVGCKAERMAEGWHGGDAVYGRAGRSSRQGSPPGSCPFALCPGHKHIDWWPPTQGWASSTFTHADQLPSGLPTTPHEALRGTSRCSCDTPFLYTHAFIGLPFKLLKMKC